MAKPPWAPCQSVRASAVEPFFHFVHCHRFNIHEFANSLSSGEFQGVRNLSIDFPPERPQKIHSYADLVDSRDVKLDILQRQVLLHRYFSPAICDVDVGCRLLIFQLMTVPDADKPRLQALVEAELAERRHFDGVFMQLVNMVWHIHRLSLQNN